MISCAKTVGDGCSSQVSRLHDKVPISFYNCGPPHSVTEVEAFAVSLRDLHQQALEARQAVTTLEADHGFRRRTNEASSEHVREELHAALAKSAGADAERLKAKEVALREEHAAYESKYIEKLASAKQLVLEKEFAQKNIQRCLDEVVEGRMKHLAKCDSEEDSMCTTAIEGVSKQNQE